MRDNTPIYRDLLKLVRTDVMSDGSVKLVYYVEDQPPKKFYANAYRIAGWQDNRGQCSGNVTSDDPYFPYSCKDESILIDWWVSNMLVDQNECSYTNIAVEGNYIDPFSTSYGNWPGPTGYLVKSDYSSNPRKLVWDIYCTVWGTGTPAHGSVSLDKFQSLVCPDNYRLRDAVSPRQFPSICQPMASMPYITTRLKQCQSDCTKDGNPIVSSTGNKEYRHTDFTWEGLEFTRSYNSVRDFPLNSGLGGNWTHIFSDRLLISGAYVSWVRESGYVELLEQLDATHYRSQSMNGVLAVKEVDPAVAGSLWKVHERGVVRWFDTNGSLLKLRQGQIEFALHYCLETDFDNAVCDDLGALTSITSNKNRELTFVRSPANGDADYRWNGIQASVIKQVISAGKILVSYEYDNLGRLVSAKPAQSTSGLVYKYAEAGFVCRNLDGAHAADCSDGDFAYQLTGIVDENGMRFATYGYDSSGRANLSEHSGGVDRVSLSYQSNSMVNVVQPLGAIKSYVFQSGLHTVPLSSITTDSGGSAFSATYAYSSYRLSSFTVGQGRTDFVYGDYARNSVIEGLEPNGTDTLSKRTIQTTWHPTVPAPTERRTLNVAGALVAKQIWTYNTYGQALTATQTDPSAGISRTTTTTYCEQPDIDVGNCPLLGLVTSVDGPRTDISDLTIYTYYASDDAACASAPTTCPHRKGDLWKVTNALGQVTETLKYDGAGRVLSVKDPTGVITDMTYHPRGWLTARKLRGTNDASETDDRITTIDYWPTGLVKQVTQPDGAFTTYTYDAAHRLTDIADNAGNTIHYTLDNAGNRVKEDTKDNAGTLKRTLSRVYNQLGQLATQADAGNNPTDLTYDANGNTDTVTDALGRVTDNDYDPLNRLVRTLQDVGGIAAETKFAYDAQDNLTKVTDPKGLDTTYAYNGLGDLMSQTSPDTGATTYTYDSAGNRKTQTDARGKTATYSYDALNRLTRVEYPNTSSNASYDYDTTRAVCTAGETFSRGRLTRLQDASGTTEYCYDRFGDLLRKVQTTNGNVFTLRYTYTKSGQLASLTYPDGAVIDYIRDAQGRVTEVGAQPAGGAREVLLNQVTYLPFGPSAGWVYGNGRSLLRSHDQDYRPERIYDGSAGGLSTSYGFDEVGNLTSLKDGTQTTPLAGYGYDALSRLTTTKDGATGTPIETYGYDATGNRTSLTSSAGTSAYTYPATSHRLDSVGSVARTHDAAGNTTQIGGTARQFVYTDAGRLGQVKAGGVVTMTYQYNARGEQVRKYPTTTSTAQVYSVYDEAGHWLGDYDSTGATLQQAVWLDDMPVGLLAGAGTGQKLHYVEPDHLGTPRVVIEQARNVAIWKWDAKGEAFGNTAPDQNPDGDANAFVFNMRFMGQRYDQASGLNYNYLRDGFDNTTGRYTQSDPTGLNAGVATYAYASGSPLLKVDPSGLMWFGPTCDTAQRAAIMSEIVRLANEIKDKADKASSGCPGGDCDWRLAADVMRWITKNAYFSCNRSRACAEVSGSNGYPYIYLYPPYIGAPDSSKISQPGQCGCFRSALFHEVSHEILPGMDENDIRRKTVSCVSCATNVQYPSGAPL